MEAATKTEIFSLIEIIALVAGLGLGGWTFVCLVRQQTQKALFLFFTALFLISLQKVSEVSRNTFSFTGISLAGAVGAQDSALSSTLNTIDFSFAIVGYAFFVKSIFMFAQIPDGRVRAAEAFVVLLAAVVLNNLGSVLQILLKSLVTV